MPFITGFVEAKVHDTACSRSLRTLPGGEDVTHTSQSAQLLAWFAICGSQGSPIPGNTGDHRPVSGGHRSWFSPGEALDAETLNSHLKAWGVLDLKRVGGENEGERKRR